MMILKRMDGKRNDDDDDAAAAAEKPTDKQSLSDVTKMPPRMASVDDSVMLPESYEPQEEDVICSWARQNHGHRKYNIMSVAIEMYSIFIFCGRILTRLSVVCCLAIPLQSPLYVN